MASCVCVFCVCFACVCVCVLCVCVRFSFFSLRAGLAAALGVDGVEEEDRLKVARGLAQELSVEVVGEVQHARAALLPQLVHARTPRRTPLPARHLGRQRLPHGEGGGRRGWRGSVVKGKKQEEKR